MSWLVAALSIFWCLELSGCGRSPHTSAPRTPVRLAIPATPTGFSHSVLSIHLAYLRARSFTPDRHFAVPLAGRHTLYVMHSICSGSSDGHCQEVDAFLDGQRDPLLDQQYAAVQRLGPTPNGFRLTVQSFLPSDPLCCPSGPMVTDTYTWNGHALARHGPPPGQP
jgi:hypothetical protein